MILNHKIIALAPCLILGLWSHVLGVSAEANVPSTRLNMASYLKQDDRLPAPHTGTPGGNRDGGGTRPELTQSCPDVPYGPTAIVPENGNGHTALDYPTLWFYIPYHASDIHQIEFTLINQDYTQTLFQSDLALGEIDLAENSGMIQLQLPADSMISLELGQSHRWYLRINCQPKDELALDDFLLTGWITRSTSNSEFRWDGVWFDTFDQAASNYHNNPQDQTLKKEWLELLDSVSLSYLEQ